MKAKTRLGDRLIAAGHLTSEQLAKALDRKRETGRFLGDVIVELGFVPPEIVGEILAEMVGIPYVRLTETDIEPQAAALVPEAVQRAHGLVAYKIDAGMLFCAMSDPLDVLAMDDLQLISGLRIEPRLALRIEIEEAQRRLFSVRVVAQDLIEEIQASDTSVSETDLSADQLAGLAEDAPIIRLVNSIITEGISARASDIHIEPQAGSVRVRYRLDGMLVERMTFPMRLLPAVVSRVKIMSHMNIAERRRSQDGRLIVQVQGGGVELRVSTLLIAHGEKVVMRILDKRSISVPLEDLGFIHKQLETWNSFIERPYGIILVTGPTGSGKSTTLYTSLAVLNDESRNVITVEDPIEYDLQGVNQSQVNTRIGVTFAAGLRTIVRQDPDVIMVGEIRDTETAEIAVQAALTGHLVLSTLHTNDAPGALVRLQNLGVEPFLVASSVIGVIGQRLVRRNCTHCMVEDRPDPRLLERLSVTQDMSRSATLRRGTGCRSCDGRGMQGRTAVYEVMPVSTAMQDAVSRSANGAELRDIAMREGMMTMCEAGVCKALTGETAFAEVGRLLIASDTVVRPDVVAGAIDASSLPAAA